jgi:hypothetical protein
MDMTPLLGKRELSKRALARCRAMFGVSSRPLVVARASAALGVPVPPCRAQQDALLRRLASLETATERRRAEGRTDATRT